MNAIIVDDEESARDVLYSLLKRGNPEINVVAKCCNIEEAVDKIKNLRPDVVFLDVEMPNYAGYEIVDFFDEIDFEIIFVTAFDKYAIKAFELSAIDYLVKPINRSRLKDAVEKLKEKMSHKIIMGDYQAFRDSMATNKLEKLVIPEVGNKRIVLLNEIIAIEAKGSYSEVYLRNENHFIVSKGLKYFDTVLPDNSSFFRTHKSWIINTNCIESYNKGLNQISMKGGIIAKLSKYRLIQFESQMAMKL
jgi:two-component system, LytTR family, response regulator